MELLNITTPLMEVCIDSLESGIEAELGGASRVELCSALFEGGLTPSYGLISRVCSKLSIPVNVLIRPRGGDFCYSSEEFEVMKIDIEMCKKLNVSGIVIGILTANGEVDLPKMKEIIEIARPLSITFHRAFDMTKDAIQSLETIISLRIERILTSGQESTCLEGLDLLTQLVKHANGRICIMPGGGINERNVKKILQTCKAKEFHVSARVAVDSQMKYRNEKCFMGGVLRPPEFSISRVTSQKVSNFLSNLK